MRRSTTVLPALVLALAACAGPDTGGQGTDDTTEPTGAMTSMAASPAASGSARAGETGAVERIDIGVLAEDPSAYEGSEVRILGRVDAVVAEEQAFYTSPAGGEEGRLLVVLTDDARVDREIAERNVLWITGTVVAASADELESAGAVMTEIPDDFAGEWAIVATEIGDPLAPSDGADATDGADEADEADGAG